MPTSILPSLLLLPLSPKKNKMERRCGKGENSGHYCHLHPSSSAPVPFSCSNQSVERGVALGKGGVVVVLFHEQGSSGPGYPELLSPFFTKGKWELFAFKE